MKTTYTITVFQSPLIGASAVTRVQAKTLAAAKATATKRQIFQGRVEIKDSSGLRAINEGGKWRDIPRAQVLYRFSHRPTEVGE